MITPGAGLPAPTETPQQLEQMPSAAPSTGSSSSGGTSSSVEPTGSGARAPTGKINYEAARPSYRVGRFRRGPLTGSPTSASTPRTPTPTSGSASGSAAVSRSRDIAITRGQTRFGGLADTDRNELSLLDNLPPLDLPHETEQTEFRTTSRASVRGTRPDESAAEPPPAKEAEVLLETTEIAKTTPSAAEPTAAPGLKRFSVVAPGSPAGASPPLRASTGSPTRDTSPWSIFATRGRVNQT